MSAATSALRQLQGFPFYDKPMRIAYARVKSDVISKNDGSFVPREKPEPKKQKTTSTTPSNVLFAQQLPDDCNDLMLAMLFQQYTGFKEVRMVPGKQGIAFVEFADDVQASLALQALNGFKLTPDLDLQLSYAKR